MQEEINYDAIAQAQSRADRRLAEQRSRQGKGLEHIRDILLRLPLLTDWDEKCLNEELKEDTR